MAVLLYNNWVMYLDHWRTKIHTHTHTHTHTHLSAHALTRALSNTCILNLYFYDINMEGDHMIYILRH